MEESPRRWVVKREGKCFEVEAELKGVVTSLYPGCQMYLMGSHETLREALKRVGWL